MSSLHGSDPSAQEEPIVVLHESVPPNEPVEPKRTPLPKFQLFIVFLIQFSEPVTSTVIYPFVNQFVRDTGVIEGDERKTGYYAGMIGSAFFFAEALTVFHWGRASDRFGRRPVLLLGPIGLSLAMLSFGLSHQFWTLVVSRCIQGIFNGNIGVSKSVIAEITDATNIADAYAMMPLTWTIGSTIGPILGGILSQPAKRWPNVFGRLEFFRDYPYFLPCAVTGLIAFVSGAIAFAGLKETLPSAVARQKAQHHAEATLEVAKTGPEATTRLLDDDTNGTRYGSSTSSERSQPGSFAGSDATTLDDKPPPFRALLVPQVLIPLLVYMFLAFIDMCSQVLLPLMYSTSVPVGGLGFDPYRIGIIMGVWGGINAAVQLQFLAKLLRRFGPRKMLIVAHISYFFNIAIYPLLSYCAQQPDGELMVWTLIVIQLTFRMTNTMGYGSIQIIIVDSAPSSASLGATNGLAQAMASFTRSIAPSVASSLFSMSLENRVAGGNMVYIVLSGLALLGLRLAFLLPKQLRMQSQ